VGRGGIHTGPAFDDFLVGGLPAATARIHSGKRHTVGLIFHDAK
jgi:hypothetical protein